MPREERRIEEELRIIQDEMLHVAHELTLAQARLHRLSGRVELPQEDLDDDALSRSLEHHVHGNLEGAAEDLENAVDALRRGGLSTEELLAREALREQRLRDRGSRRRLMPSEVVS